MFLERILKLGNDIYFTFLDVWEWLFTPLTLSREYGENLYSWFWGLYPTALFSSADSGSLWFAATFGAAETVYSPTGVEVTFAPIDIIIGFLVIFLTIKIVLFFVQIFKGLF